MVDLLSKNEYYPYGMKIDALSWNETGVRYGYNGTHEQELAINPEGNYLDFGDFGYDTRTAMRQNIDPMFEDYPFLSGYSTFNNDPIYFNDPTGWEPEPDPECIVPRNYDKQITPNVEKDAPGSNPLSQGFKNFNNTLFKVGKGLVLVTADLVTAIGPPPLQTGMPEPHSNPIQDAKDFGNDLWNLPGNLNEVMSSDYVPLDDKVRVVVNFVGFFKGKGKGKGAGNLLKKLLKLTYGNMRKNLIRFRGFDPGLGFHAHHMFPNKFSQKFKDAGIDINDPKYGTWWEVKSHLNKKDYYNRQWEEFFKTNPTADQILIKGRKLAKEYNLDITF